MTNLINLIERQNRLDFETTYSPVVCGNSNYYLNFKFGEAFSACANKTAVFVIEGKKILQNFEGNVCRVPVLPNCTGFLVAVYSAADAEEQLSTTFLKVRAEPSVLGGDFSEFDDQMKKYVSTIVGAVNSLENGSLVCKKAKEAEVANNVSNPNLLLNGDFKINQRGQISYNGSNVYSVDRWLLTGATSSFNAETKQFKTSTQYGSFRQIVEDYTNYAGKTVTLSCKISTFNSVGDDFYLAIADGSQTKQVKVSSSGITSVTATISGNPTRLICMLYKTGATGNLVEATIEYMKLELGEVATNFSSRVYAEEFALCQRYFQVLTNTSPYSIYWTCWFNGGTTNADGLLPIPVTMRTKPTMKMKGSFIVVKKTGGTYNISSVLVHSIYDNQLLIRCVSSGGSQGEECIVQANNDNSTSVEFDAEIY